MGFRNFFRPRGGKLAIIVPGQGFQKIGMGLAENGQPMEFLKEIANTAGEILDPLQIKEVYYLMTVAGATLSPEDKKTLKAKIDRTDNAQLSICLYNMAWWKKYRASPNYRPPKAVAGHSGGEPIAGFFAKALDEENCLKYVFNRGHLMLVANVNFKGTMIRVKPLGEKQLSLRRIADCLKKKTAKNEVTTWEIANNNSPKQVIISGRVDEADWTIGNLEGKGFVADILQNVSGAYHNSVAMAPVKSALDALLTANLITIKKPAIPWALNFTGNFEYDEKKIKVHLPAQTNNIVEWRKDIEEMLGLGVTEFIETGPGDGLTKILLDFPVWRKIQESKKLAAEPLS